MEVVDNLFMLVVPGAMAAGLASGLFWWSLAVSLAVAFVLTVPVNRWLISRGRGHAVVTRRCTSTQHAPSTTLTLHRALSDQTPRYSRTGAHPDSTTVRIARMSYALGQGTGPLAGVKVVEIAGIGPGPHACMILADLGADVIRVERPGGQALTGGPTDLLNRGRPSVALNLKDPEAIATVLDLVAEADVLVEGMRPGTTERLGLGPDECLERNPRLVYGRMTGWGQTGPLASAAGHDMNYIAITGALFGMGQDKSRPHFPANLVGDFGGGSTYLVIGVLAALLEARICGQGQVVDAAIVDGTAHLNAMSAGFLAAGNLLEERAANLLDGGMPFYDLYETSDGRHMSVGPLEPQFYDEFVKLLDIGDAPDRYDFEQTEELRGVIAERVRQPHAGRVVRGLRGHRRLRGADHPAHRGDGAPAHGGP